MVKTSGKFHCVHLVEETIVTVSAFGQLLLVRSSHRMIPLSISFCILRLETTV